MKEVLFYEEGVELPAFFSGKLIENWLEVIASHYSRKIGALSFIFVMTITFWMSTAST